MLLVLLTAVAAGCESSSASNGVTAPETSAPVQGTRVVEARLHPWPTKVRVQGSLVSDEEAMIGTKVPGRVEEVLVDRGTPVAEGQVLARLEPEDFALRVQQAEAQLAQVRARLGLQPGEPEEKLDRAKAPPVVQERAVLEETRFHFERARTLVAQKAIAVEELQKLEMAFRVAEARHATALNTVEEQVALLALRKAELALAKQQQADAVIRAPFQGVVQHRHIAQGVFLSTGQPVVTLVRTNPLRFRAAVPEREAVHIPPQAELAIQVEGQAEPITARLARVSPALELDSRSLLIEADVPNPDGRWRAGLFAEADIVVAPDAQALAVPEAAVTEFAGVEKVWGVNGGTAAAQCVETGRRDRGLVEILKGLKPGSRVLADGSKGRAGPVPETAND